MTGAALVLVLSILAVQSEVTLAGSDDLAAARALYAAGDYETALTRFSAARSESTADEVDQYRALCLLALGRTTETEQSLRDLVDRRPQYRMSEDDVSPRLVAMFHEVRRQRLPGLVRSLYGRAKRAFEDRNYAQASSDFRDVLDLVADPDVAASVETVQDMRLLAEGFLRLSDLELAAAKATEQASADAAAADVAVVRPRDAAAETLPAPAPPPIYSDSDAGIVPPVVVSRTLPAWRPASAAAAARSYQGHLRVVVDETGRVESVALARSFLPGYEDELVHAARTWRFRPATRAGVPVKFVRVFTIEVSAR